MGTYAELVRARVTAAIEASGTTVLDLADATLIPRSTLQRRLAGMSPFTVTEVAAIARHFNVLIGDLAPDEAAA